MEHRTVLTSACAVIVALAGVPSSASAQFPSASFGGYLARHGAGIEITAVLHQRGGIQARLETGTVERAAWLGGRLNLAAADPVRVYIAPLAGTHYCYPNELGGTTSGCDSRAEWKAAAALLAGLDMAMGAGSGFSAGGEFGYRFVDVGSRPRWTFAATVRYLLRR